MPVVFPCSAGEQKRLLEMEAVLGRRVVGQDEAVHAVSDYQSEI